MNDRVWNDLKGKIMAVHGPNIDWWDVRIAVNEILTRKFHLPVDSPEEAFNIAYQVKPLPHRNNNQDGSPSTRAIVEYAAIFIVLLVMVFTVYAAVVSGVMIVTALILRGIAAVAGFFRR
jgi:hypothetical protein